MTPKWTLKNHREPSELFTSSKTSISGNRCMLFKSTVASLISTVLVGPSSTQTTMTLKQRRKTTYSSRLTEKSLAEVKSRVTPLKKKVTTIAKSRSTMSQPSSLLPDNWTFKVQELTKATRVRSTTRKNGTTGTSTLTSWCKPITRMINRERICKRSRRITTMPTVGGPKLTSNSSNELAYLSTRMVSSLRICSI